MNCPRCGSPVMIKGTRWECGWCLDSGYLPRSGRPDTYSIRIVCGVDLDEAWEALRAGLFSMVPAHAERMLPSLLRAALFQLSVSAPPDGGRDARDIRGDLDDMRAFVGRHKEPCVPDAAEMIENGIPLFSGEAALDGESFGSFWQSLLDALDEEGAVPWETDSDAFFDALAQFRSWRRGGPGCDAEYLENFYLLQGSFHKRWLLRHPEE